MSYTTYENKFASQYKYYDFKDVLILPKSSELNSRSKVDLISNKNFNNKSKNIKWSGIPIIAANMTTTGTFEVYNILSKYKILTALHKFYKLEDFKKFENENGKLDCDFFMVSTGISDNDYNNLENILNNIDVKFICIDIANGYISNFKNYCKKVRKNFPDHIIMAGNVCTADGVLDLIECGVDIIKCGIGGGSACTTRIQTGIGVPQLSCIIECSEIAKENNCFIVSDGGITCPGDLGKAYGAGADFVMMGGVFAGHSENPGELIEENGEKYKLFYGMSSSYAMQNNYAANNNKNYRSSEGREIKIKFKGDLSDTVENYLGGLRSTCTYTNSETVDELFNNITFILVNNQYNSKYVN